MLFILDLLSTLCFACIGTSIALRIRMSSLGICLSAMLPAVGGGTLRDILLDTGSFFWLETPAYLLAILAALPIAFLLHRLPQRPVLVCRLLDSLATCVFIMVGVLAALDAGCNLTVVALLGTLTGIGGGIMRQLILERRPVMFLDRMSILAATITALVCTAVVFVGFTMLVSIALLGFLHFAMVEYHRTTSQNDLNSRQNNLRRMSNQILQ